ncbi:MAG: heme-copper oxidase subunit III [bacterium]
MAHPSAQPRPNTDSAPGYPRLARSGGSPPAGGRATASSNAVLGMLVFLGSEAMLFAALISAYLVLRAGADSWPPPGQPRLPLVLTGANTAVLLLSGVSMWAAQRAARLTHTVACRRWLAVTLALGGLFLLVQGSEWMHLIAYGLRISSGTYGGMFYAVIGTHALHVAVAVLVLGVVMWRARHGRFAAQRQTDVEVCFLYWTFVVAVWPVLYGLVYVL